jgi:hypothetical protein
MENELNEEKVGVMESREPMLYRIRKPVELSQWEITILSLALQDSIRYYRRQEADLIESKDYHLKLNIAESIMYRHELIARMDEAREKLFPLPF